MMKDQDIKAKITQKLQELSKDQLVEILADYLYMQTPDRSDICKNTIAVNQQFAETSQTLNDFIKQFKKDNYDTGTD